MNTSLYIAKRYLFSKKSINAINIISGISMFGVFVASAALIIILSVFNGFESVILSMYNSFSPELRIEPSYGKGFDPATPAIASIKRDARISHVNEVLQEKVLLRYNNRQFIGTVRGVSDSFSKSRGLDSIMVDGSFLLHAEGTPQAVIGASVQGSLGVNIYDEATPIELYAARKGSATSINPAEEFNVKYIHSSGVFNVQQDFNDVVIVPLSFARDLLSEPKNISAIELRIKPLASIDDVQKDISKRLGKGFLVKNRIQQNELLYKVLNVEKWAIYIILTFVLIIAIFNLVGSLTMLVIDKKKDIAILSSIGASKKLIKRIFFYEGIMISMTGCVLGLLCGIGFCLIQQRFGLIKMGDVQTITESYPIALKIADSALVILTVFSISLLTSEISSRLSVKTLDQINENL